MPNIIILCNESGLVEGRAPLGQHATLAYICAAIKEGHTVSIIDHSRDSLQSCLETGSFPALVLDQSNFMEFVGLYEERNQILANLTKNAGQELLTSDSDSEWNKVSDREVVRVRDVVARKLNIQPEEVTPEMIGRRINLSNTDLQNSYILNRLDPMLASFTQEDREAAKGNVYQDFLTIYKSLIPSVDFSDPSGKCDKIATEEVDTARIAAGLEPIYTPTSKTTVDGMDITFSSSLRESLEEEEKLFPRTEGSEFTTLPRRVIFKPVDSAQSSGVCGMEFRHDGIDLFQLRQTSIMELISEDLQLLYVREGLSDEELKEMAKILLYAQALKEEYPQASKSNGKGVKPETLKELSQTTSEEMAVVTKRLYETDILIQPFLTGVAKMGDVRLNLVADSNGNWSSVGHTFRAQITRESETSNHSVDSTPKIGSRFTTCFSAGKAAPTRVEYLLSETEIESFNAAVEGLLWTLNVPLKTHYKKCQELGVDLVPVGDGKNFKLGEINHTDPALAPVSAALRKGAFDLAVEIRNKGELASEKEQNFLKIHQPIMEQEEQFVAEKYVGGLGPMITSLQNVIERQNIAREITKEQHDIRPGSPSSMRCTGLVSGIDPRAETKEIGGS